MVNQPLHIFDMDGTLFPFNVSYQFGIFLKNRNYFPLTARYRLLAYYISYKIGLHSVDQLHKSSFEFFLRGKKLEDLKKQAKQFLDQHLLGQEYQPCLEKLYEAKNIGAYTVLISSSAQFLVDTVADWLGFDRAIGTTYCVNEGDEILSLKRIINGQAKLETLNEISTDMQIPLQEAMFFTDSLVDKPLLDVVGFPVAVNPEKSFIKHAIQNGIPII